MRWVVFGLILAQTISPIWAKSSSTDNLIAGREFLKSGEYQTALSFFLDAYAGNPKHPDLNYYIGKTYFHLKDYSLAQKYFEKVTTTNVHFHTALSLMRTLAPRSSEPSRTNLKKQARPAFRIALDAISGSYADHGWKPVTLSTNAEKAWIQSGLGSQKLTQKQKRWVEQTILESIILQKDNAHVIAVPLFKTSFTDFNHFGRQISKALNHPFADNRGYVLTWYNAQFKFLEMVFFRLPGQQEWTSELWVYDQTEIRPQAMTDSEMSLLRSFLAHGYELPLNDP